MTPLQFYYLQTQSCNWRNPKNKSVRKRRDLIDDEEDASKTFNETLSESVSLFQSIQVLQTDEDELSFQNQTTAGIVIYIFKRICAMVVLCLLLIYAIFSIKLQSLCLMKKIPFAWVQFCSQE